MTMLVIDRDRLLERERESSELHRHAIRLAGAAERALELARAVNPSRNPLFLGRCYLCGLHVHPAAWYCREHQWAAKEDSCQP